MADKEQLAILTRSVEAWNLWRRAHRTTLANLSGVNLQAKFLHDADLYKANLRDANLTYAHLLGADLRTADLQGARLGYADLLNANLSGANLRGAHLNLANCQNANFTGATMRQADLRGANLARAQLVETDLTRCASFASVCGNSGHVLHRRLRWTAPGGGIGCWRNYEEHHWPWCSL